MTLTDIIAGAIVILIVGAAVVYIIRQKKHGVKCIGCPYAESCTGGGCTPPPDLKKADGSAKQSAKSSTAHTENQ